MWRDGQPTVPVLEKEAWRLTDSFLGREHRQEQPIWRGSMQATGVWMDTQWIFSDSINKEEQSQMNQGETQREDLLK